MQFRRDAANSWGSSLTYKMPVNVLANLALKISHIVSSEVEPTAQNLATGERDGIPENCLVSSVSFWHN